MPKTNKYLLLKKKKILSSALVFSFALLFSLFFSASDAQAATTTPIDDLSATAASSTQIDLTWTANDDTDFDHYEVYRATSSPVSTSSYLIASTSDQNASSTTDSGYDGLNDGNEYFYQIYVFYTDGDVATSNATSTFTDDYTPNAVTNFSAAAASSTAINLNWDANEDPDYAFSRYERYRATSRPVSTSSELIATITDQTVTSTTNIELSDGNDYFYKIYVADLDDDNGEDRTESNATSATTTDYDNTPIDDLVATASSSTEISLSWTANEDPEYAFSRYEIYRATSSPVSTSSELIATITDQTVTSTTNIELSDGNDYFYKIYVADLDDDNRGDRTESNATSATTTDYDNTPIDDLVATASSSTEISLSWTANEDPESAFSRYEIYRSETSGDSTSSELIATITDQTVTSTTDIGLKDGNDYFYKIYVVDLDDDNGEDRTESNATSATTTDYDNTPIDDLVATASSSTEISLSWTANSDPSYAFSQYKIYRNRNGGVNTSDTPITTINTQGTASFSDSGIPSGTQYYYKIYTLDNNDDDGADIVGSSEASATTDGSGGGTTGGGGGGGSYTPTEEEEEEPDTGTTTEDFTVLSPEMEVQTRTYTYRENGLII